MINLIIKLIIKSLIIIYLYKSRSMFNYIIFRNYNLIDEKIVVVNVQAYIVI